MFCNYATMRDIEREESLENFSVIIDQDKKVYFICRDVKVSDAISLANIEAGESYILNDDFTIAQFESLVSTQIIKVYRTPKDYKLTFEDA